MRVLFVSLFVVITDQVTKLIVKGISIPAINLHFEGLRYGQSHDVIGSFFRIIFVENPGMAFGINVGVSSKLFLSLFSLFASIGIIIYMFKIRDERLVIRVALALILGGAVGNLIDRTFYGIIYSYAPIFYGKVVDFFSVDFFDFTLFGHTYERWPIFNIADSSVTIGVLLLVMFHRSIDAKKESSDKIENAEAGGSNVALQTEGTGNIGNAEVNGSSSNTAGDNKSKLEDGKDNIGKGTDV